MCSTKASCLFEVSAVMEKSDAGRPAAALLGAEGRVGQDEVGLGQAPRRPGESVSPLLDAALDAVQHQVHQAEPVRVRAPARAPTKALWRWKYACVLGQLEEVVGVRP